MQHLVKKYHRYEYERTKKQSFIFFFIMFLHEALKFLMVFFDHQTASGVDSEEYHYCREYYQTGLSDKNSSFLMSEYFFLGILSWQTLIADWNILYMKSTKDILQGISKLDNLLKVSIIQINKKVKDES